MNRLLRPWLVAVWLSPFAGTSGCALEPDLPDDGIGSDRWGTQCGLDWDSQHVELYDGSYSVSVDFVDRKQRPVGQIQWKSDLAARYANPGDVSGVRWCSGTLIAADLFLTAGHCFDSDPGTWTSPRQPGTNQPLTSEQAAREMVVNFDYQLDGSGVPRAEQTFDVVDLVEDSLGGVDFAILRLEGDPGQIYGIAPIRDEVAVDDPIAMIGHPAGWRKQVAAGTVANSLNTQLVHYRDLDTLGGSSGSGIIHADSGAIIGVHTNGGCQDSVPNYGANYGVRISYIRTVSPTIQQLSRRDWGWVYAQSATGSYTASPGYSRNSSGGATGEGVANTVTRLSTGLYRVDFPDLGDDIVGNVQATAYGSGNERCKVGLWLPISGTLQVYIACHDATGARVDTRFLVSYVHNGIPGGDATGAYLWTLDPSAATSTPPIEYQWNSTGALNRIERTATGVYRAILPGQAPAPRGGTVQVTAFDDSSDYCKVRSWMPSGSDMVVNVGCFDTTGAPTDSQFSLYYSATWAAGGNAGGHAYAHNATAASYAPLGHWEYIASSAGGDPHVWASRTATGRYTLDYPTLASTGSTALVTAYGTGSEYCKIRSWSGNATTTAVRIGCFNASGVSTDTRFVSGYATQ